jgi:hypothetical protein
MTQTNFLEYDLYIPLGVTGKKAVDERAAIAEEIVRRYLPKATEFIHTWDGVLRMSGGEKLDTQESLEKWKSDILSKIATDLTDAEFVLSNPIVRNERKPFVEVKITSRISSMKQFGNNGDDGDLISQLA